MKPWREIAHPHPDVLEGTFQQSEFAADISAVRTGKATREYQDAAAFFQRTFITEGMRLLLTSVAKRLNGQGGDPVIQLQTAFGGGKTHTMLAVYHLATRKCPIKDLVGIPALLDQAGLMDVPKSQIAVLDGTNMAPGQSRKEGSQTINTLWGELAWQLGKDEAFALVREADANGTSPGKDVIKKLLERSAPCVILIDELVAYVRQFPESQTLSGGSYDSNLSFIQALTEAVKLVPNALLLASLPESEIEAGSQRGIGTLKALEKTFGRVQALWKPVATEEAFEIVRRRLFEPVTDVAARDEVCRAFAQTYITEGSKLPGETQEAHYLNRLVQAYPIHPEIFSRLYEDWTTLDSFQRTRGVLKFMAKVIFKLWKDNNGDRMILPGSLPLYDGNTRNELTYYLSPGWDAVLDKDIDGDRAETTALENKEPRFGELNAARRVARTIFFGSAPGSVGTKPGIRGLDRARVLLGCLQPGQTASTYVDALGRLADRLHYLSSSGDKSNEATRYWFDTRANLRREMEDRKGRFNDQHDVRDKLAAVLSKLASNVNGFGGVHVFSPHADVLDDGTLRLVFLPPEKFFVKSEPRLAAEEAMEFVRNNGSKPRMRGNRLMFVAPDQASLGRLREGIRTALAWGSIIDDVKGNRLNIDRLQEQHAVKELQTAEEVLPRVARETYKWLLCPMMERATDRQQKIESFPLNASGNTYAAEIERVCRENELIITAWSPIHLREILKELYWKPERTAVGALEIWEDTLRYSYLPRLKDRNVFSNTIIAGAGTKDFFGTAYAQSGEQFEGFRFGDDNIQFDNTLLLIEPEAAKKYVEKIQKATESAGSVESTPSTTTGSDGHKRGGDSKTPTGDDKKGVPTAAAKSFHGSVDIKAAAAKMQLQDVVDEVIRHLGSDPNTTIKITLEIQAEFPNGAPDEIKRTVSENTKSLNFRVTEWE